MRIKEIGLLLAAVLLMAGCKGEDETVVRDDGDVNVSMAYTFNTKSAGDQTRQASSVTEGLSPDYTDLRIVALKDESPMKSYVSWTTATTTSGFYHYDNCQLTVGINRCLVYVQAQTPPSSVSSEVYNGSLVSFFPSSFSSWYDVHTISFGLESIYSNPNAPAGATPLANALTEVANIAAWKNSDNEVLKNFRKNLTNGGFNMPGSAADVRQLLNIIASSAQSYIDNPPENIGDAETTILGTIKKTAEDQLETDGVKNSSYPRDIRLPDGAAVLQWNDAKEQFEPQTGATNLDNINALWRFAYPASLYYFCDSPIKTSDSNFSFSSYSNWSDVLSAFPNNTIVTTATKAVALTNPMEYAVARLKVNMKANDEKLTDNGDEDVSIGAANFKLTGIIIGGQRPVDYLFNQESNDETNMKFIYDSQVKNASNADCYLAYSKSFADGPTTLVLQSYDGENVNIILEFENMSDNIMFKGLDGFIYPHTRFYLIGKIPALTGNNITSDDKTHRVFTKDYTTTVNVTISSLANAYSVLPNLLSSNLAVGLEATPQWTAAKPTTKRLE